jgi:molybdenum cofactor cytidylyltransferase
MIGDAPRPIGAVLLAGGASERFGPANKLLAEINGVPLVRRAADAILAAGVTELIVVTGSEHGAYVTAFAGLAVTFVPNPSWAKGMGGSVATGVRALPPACGGTFIVPGDMPRLTAGMLRDLAARFAAEGGARIIVPVTSGGEQRNPVLWPARHFSLLAGLAGPEGAKSLLASLDAERLDVAFDDDSVFTDIDTQGDYNRLISGA